MNPPDKRIDTGRWIAGFCVVLGVVLIGAGMLLRRGDPSGVLSRTCVDLGAALVISGSIAFALGGADGKPR